MRTSIIVIFFCLFVGKSKLTAQNNIDCNTWLTDPCETFGGCTLATAKLYPYYPNINMEPIEYNLPVPSSVNCAGSNKSLVLPLSIKFSDNSPFPPCTNYTIDAFKRFCYKTNSEEYAKLFIYYNINDFLDKVGPLMGTYEKTLIINPINNSYYTVFVRPLDLTGGYAKIDYGDKDDFHLGTDLFYVVQGAAQGYLLTHKWNSDLMWVGISQYMAQSYIKAVHNNAINGSSDNVVEIDRTCNEDDFDQVIATLLYQIETDSIYGIGREKLHKVLKEAFNKFSLNLQLNLNKPAPFATSFFKTCTQISSLHPTLLSGHDLCKIRTVISNYFTPNCDQPTLDVVVDYYIADDVSDIGIRPNPSNASEWESPAIVNRNAHDGLFTNQSAKADTENTLYVEIKNAGCDSLVDARLEIYYALSQTGLTWDDAWDNNIITVGNTDIQAGAKIADIFLPSIPVGGIRVPVTWTPPNIDALNIPSTKINLLARIVSATDVMQETEVKDIRANVRKNNNIAWKVLQLEK
jgi:hypothetical protein